LEAYATEDRLEGELAVYAGYFDEEDLVKLKQALLTPVEVDTVAIANFLYSPQGKVILEKVSKIIQTQAHQPGFYALRSALILASAEEEGLTLLNFLRQIPVRGLRINSLRGLEIIGDLRKIIKQTQKAIALVEQQQLVEQNQTPVSNFSLPDLREAGKQKFRRQVLTLRDKRRNRSFPVELYLPENNNREKLANLIVISHGLGSDRRSFAYLAQHLASHGFAVAVPEHPGSNAAQVEALFTGKSKQIPPRELIDRPLDIKYLLDELERNYKEQINVKEVGIIGQSFGAYTVLAVAGAELNYSNLQAGCQNLADTYNISLLLQCAILNEPPYPGKLRDERIVAAIAINPLASTIFGKEGLNKIKIPVMLVAGSADAVTPALAEQIIPFTWLNTADKYLALLGGGTHFSVIAESTG
ncbi:MAG: alpha/beta hydrolase, partial [Cyanobacteria bacterium J083]